jgi:putative transposase
MPEPLGLPVGGAVRQRFRVSERRACGVLGQPRSTQRFERSKREGEGEGEGEDALVARMTELAKKHARFGYRCTHALLVRASWRVNRKRVQRLWRLEGLKVPPKPRKRQRLGSSESGCVRHRAEYKNHVWSYDLRRTTAGV